MPRSDRLSTSTLRTAVIWLMQPQNSFPPLEMCCIAIVFKGCELREEEACFACCGIGRPTEVCGRWAESPAQAERILLHGSFTAAYKCGNA
ncbi:hypothetical protein QQF64_004425 [Cirrhinus molitorella]|uniref:Uncharacterized protein n=1 Tax=Cirrhinus molitorella TaxID=172907 RepID=A0ABR3MHH8_9TELE